MNALIIFAIVACVISGSTTYPHGFHEHDESDDCEMEHKEHRGRGGTVVVVNGQTHYFGPDDPIPPELSHLRVPQIPKPEFPNIWPFSHLSLSDHLKVFK